MLQNPLTHFSKFTFSVAAKTGQPFCVAERPLTPWATISNKSSDSFLPPPGYVSSVGGPFMPTIMSELHVKCRSPNDYIYKTKDGATRRYLEHPYNVFGSLKSLHSY